MGKRKKNNSVRLLYVQFRAAQSSNNQPVHWPKSFKKNSSHPKKSGNWLTKQIKNVWFISAIHNIYKCIYPYLYLSITTNGYKYYYIYKKIRAVKVTNISRIWSIETFQKLDILNSMCSHTEWMSVCVSVCARIFKPEKKHKNEEIDEKSVKEKIIFRKQMKRVKQIENAQASVCTRDLSMPLKIRIARSFAWLRTLAQAIH